MADKMMMFLAQKRSILASYLLWYFVSWTGFHRYYLGYKNWWYMLTLFVASLDLILLGVDYGSMQVFEQRGYGPQTNEVWELFSVVSRLGLLGALALLVWVIVDFFLIPGMVQRYNEKLAKKLS